jgi:ABC-2 type transport system permease protein
MLWYKAWLETRSRFLIALVGCTVLCVQLVRIVPRTAGPDETFLLLRGVHFTLVFVWTMGVTLLFIGGLLRERAVGSSSFTLSLPVSRFRLMSVRVGMGIVEALALAVIPWAGMLVAAHVAIKVTSLSLAGFQIFLLLGGGIVFMMTSLLVSSLVEGEYTAPIVSFGATIMLVYALSSKRLSPYSPWTFMMGIGYFHRQTPLAIPPIPWIYAGAFLAIAALIAIVSIKVIQRCDF